MFEGRVLDGIELLVEVGGLGLELGAHLAQDEGGGFHKVDLLGGVWV